MIPMSAGEIADIVHGRLHQLDPAEIITQNPSIDSRTVTVDDFFLAFVGENADGHDFAAAAISAGAKFALVSKSISGPSILVADTGIALRQLATAVRTKMAQLTVIGITGSQGKTTTKDLLHHLLLNVALTIAPAGNLNNEIGVPLTLLRCTEATKFCIVEMGARHVGDIAELVKIAQPDIGVVLNIGRAHIGEFGSRVQIAQAKGELIAGLNPGAIAILGNYDEFTPYLADAMPNRKIVFGEKGNCEVRAADVELREGRAHFDLVTPEGRKAVSLQLLGLHQISNALAVAAIATAIGIPLESIAALLSTAEPNSKWRMQLHEEAGLLLINDAYNANPDSMAAALRTLALLAQERGGLSWAFLGKMNELGESTAEEHRAIGRLVSDIGIDHLVVVGTTLFTAGRKLSEDGGDDPTVHECESIDDALPLSDHFSSGDVVLVKASRSEHLDELAEKLLDRWREKPV